MGVRSQSSGIIFKQGLAWGLQVIDLTSSGLFGYLFTLFLRRTGFFYISIQC